MSDFVVWIDSNEARLFCFGRDAVTESTIESPRDSHAHRHPKDGLTRTHNHPDDEVRFFADVAAALGRQGRVLLVGPGIAKLHFLRHAHAHDPALESRIAAIETVDHPTDRQIVAYARRYFVLDATPPR